MIDIDEWQERAAIMQFDGGLSRFRAETEAARRQGHERWEVMNALGGGNSGAARDQGSAHERHEPDDMPGLQPGSQEADRPLPVGDGPAGRGGVVLPSLRVAGR